MTTTSITTPAELGAALRAARRARNLRLEDVALGAGVGVRFLSELERGKPTSRLADTLRVAASLGVHLGLEDTDDRPYPCRLVLRRARRSADRRRRRPPLRLRRELAGRAAAATVAL